MPPDAITKSATILVLVAEHNSEDRVVIELLLRRLGCRSLIVSGGAESWYSLQAQPFDVAILDLRLPGVDGLALGRRIQAEMAMPPKLIALTGSAVDPDLVLCAEAGFAAVLVKPVRDSDLRRVLHATVGWGAPHQGTKDVWNLKNLTSFFAICGVKADPMIRTVLDDTSSWLDAAILPQPGHHIAAGAHKLAGSALLIGALQLAESLAAIETLPSTGREELAEAIEKAQQACVLARRELPACAEAAHGDIARRPRR